MKKILTLFLPILFLSCGSQKFEAIDSEKKINELFKLKKVVVNYPESWTYKLDHNSIAYTPKDLNDYLHKCKVQIFNFNGSILEIGPINQLNKSKEELEKIGLPKNIQTRFGNTDIYKVTNIYELRNTEELITYIFHFSHKNNFYILRYQADKKYFDKYLKDVDYFIENLDFKNDKN
ncbi:MULTISPECIES: hypothetical protein [Tenacibaculum]|uniref:hypothetical protein n=1 Tax=Tenacibaculum TaxID=104267 RepID=UPI001F0B3959|nr:MULTISPECIES: hypothetical protein [Tenacibaculum]MCH3881089.1 hypothetical protein [Tenacibaculum aquimarinum]MDO6599311.1 hypothetical protein [Tenacibaculum sp. 1_MG-2023]